MNAVLLIVLTGEVLMGLLVGWIWRRKGGSFTVGVALGTLLSVVGLLIALVAQPRPVD